MANLLDLLKSKQKELSARKSRDNTVKVPNGQSRWRILPHWSGDENAGLPSQDYGKHFVKDFSGEVKAVYICTAKTFGKSCPVCDTITSAEFKVTDENTKNLLGNAKAAQRYLVNAIRRNDKTGAYDQEVVILELPSTAFDEVMNLAVQYASDGINVFSLSEGYDVIFNREGTGTKTKYKAMLAPKSTAVDTSVMTKASDLSKYVEQEYDEGKTKALVALANLSGSSAPMLPSGVASLPRATSAEPELVATVGKTSTAPASVGAKAEEAELDVDLSEIDLEGVELAD